jgi:hypothetical protein
MIPRSKEAIKDMVVSGAFIVAGIVVPSTNVFSISLGGIFVGTGIGWLVKSIIDHLRGVKSEK